MPFNNQPSNKYVIFWCSFYPFLYLNCVFFCCETQDVHIKPITLIGGEHLSTKGLALCKIKKKKCDKDCPSLRCTSSCDAARVNFFNNALSFGNVTATIFSGCFCASYRLGNSVLSGSWLVAVSFFLWRSKNWVCYDNSVQQVSKRMLHTFTYITVFDLV